MSSQAINNQRFTAEAEAWDSNTKHVESTEAACKAIKEYIPAFKNGKNKDLRVLEIGCGTGLLSYMLAPSVHSLIGVDTADGMIAAFDIKLANLEKTQASTPPNLCSLNHFLTSADSPDLQATASRLEKQLGETDSDSRQGSRRFDLVVSHLTLHHIPDMSELLGTLFDCLAPGGMVALTDYENFGTEAIRFHPVAKRPGVERHGMVRAEVEKQLMDAGFEHVKVEMAFELKKEVDSEEGMEELSGEMAFPFLMCFGVKR